MQNENCKLAGVNRWGYPNYALQCRAFSLCRDSLRGLFARCSYSSARREAEKNERGFGAPLVIIFPSQSDVRSPLKYQLQGELNVARTAAAQERITDSDVRCDRNRQKSLSPAGNGIDAVGAGVGRKARQQRRRKVRMVKQIEHLCPELKLDLLSYRRRLDQRHVIVTVTRSAQ